MNYPVSPDAAFTPNWPGRSSLRLGFALIPLTIAWLSLSRAALAVTPAPDGGYPSENTAEGQDALFSLTTGVANTANGFEALYSNTTGSNNTANGYRALHFNTAGSSNTATGFSALYSYTGTENSVGHNTANGFEALFNNASGFQNTATGSQALAQNSGGIDNTTNGVTALYSNSSGSYNTATGFSALVNNTTGSDNTASGLFALYANSIGHDNTAEGYQSLRNSTGSLNIGLGSNAGANLTTGSNNIDIGNVGVAGESARIRIGKEGTQTATYVAGIFGATVANGVAVRVDSTGHLGTLTSSARFKEAIKPMDKASEAVLALKPVTFRYKHDLDPDGIPQFGLVAEQVEKVNPNLVARDADGKINTVRYEAVNAMLLNEFLKEHQKVQALEGKAQIGDRKAQTEEATIVQLKKQIEALTATVQKVSDQVALSKPAPRLVTDP